MTEPARTVPIALAVAGATDVGRQRTHNEDAVLLCPHLHLFLLADGAGGHNAGEIASALATRSIANYFEATERTYRDKPDVDDFGLFTQARRLGAAVQKANRDVIEIGTASNKHSGMGTTIVAASVSPRLAMLHVAHVGDSRCYRLRHGVLEQLTYDHSLIVDALELRPDIEDELLARLPTNVITRALGMEATVRVPVRSHEIVVGDIYLLCSDGLTTSLAPAELAGVLARDKSPDELVHELIDLANQAGGDDNISAVVMACEAGPPRSRRRSPSSRPPPKRAKEPLTGRTNDDSAPEIMLIGIEEIDVEAGGGIHVLPKQSADDEILSAVEDFFAPIRHPSSPREKGARPVVRCTACGEPVGNAFCPHCGTPRP